MSEKDMYDSIRSVIDKTSKVKSKSKKERDLDKKASKNVGKAFGAVMKNEDWAEKVKLIKEISKKRAAAYVKAASVDLMHRGHEHGRDIGQEIAHHQRDMEQNKPTKYRSAQRQKELNKQGKKMISRQVGIDKAVKRLSKEDYGAGFDGTTELDDKYRKETPGQSPTLKKVKKVVTEKLRSYKRVKKRKLYGSPRPGEDETLKRHINPQKAATHGERRADRNLAKTLPKD
jgi:hypothetical protein